MIKIVGHGRQIEGVVVLKLSDEVINTIMTERSGLSETTEAYLVGPDGSVREKRSSASGIRNVPDGDFRSAFEGLVGGWSDETGKRLAKRADSVALAALRADGWTPEDVRTAVGL